MAKIGILIFDLLFVISGFIGVGFATGEELEQFFTQGNNLILSVGAFFVVYFLVCLAILKLKHKHNLKDMRQLNKFAFGEYSYVFDAFLLILFLITSSAMLAGCDNILRNNFDIAIPIGSLTLSVITLFFCTKEVTRIKQISNIIIPILIVFICVNVAFNRGEYVGGNGITGGVIFPILFCCENCVMLISVLLKTKSNPLLLSTISGIILSVILFFATRVVTNFLGDMPLLLASKNVSRIFYLCYLLGITLALFLTLQISQHNVIEICNRSKKSNHFLALIFVLVSQTISFLGLKFIVKYLYSAMGICGAIYILILFIKIIINNKKYNKIKNK